MTVPRGYAYHYTVRREGFVPWKLLSAIFADAAAWLENNPQYDANLSIYKATDHLSDRVASVAAFAFRDAYGAWTGDDEGVLMLCFAAAAARTGDL